MTVVRVRTVVHELTRTAGVQLKSDTNDADTG
jgi:hypothetical protein